MRQESCNTLLWDIVPTLLQWIWYGSDMNLTLAIARWDDHNKDNKSHKEKPPTMEVNSINVNQINAILRRSQTTNSVVDRCASEQPAMCSMYISAYVWMFKYMQCMTKHKPNKNVAKHLREQQLHEEESSKGLLIEK